MINYIMLTLCCMYCVTNDVISDDINKTTDDFY